MSGIVLPASADSWQAKAIGATGGNQTRLGCMVLAILGWQHGRKPPRFGSTATILEDGTVITNFQNKEGKMFKGQSLGSIEFVNDEFRRLADKLKLRDKQRKEMFHELRLWCAVDKRAKSTLD